jgi:putative CRISPR-associated protein (TIGR02619 family)
MIMICTTGTSIARDIAWNGDPAAYRSAIRARVAGFAGKPSFAALLCAEANSLHRYGTARVKRVALLHSETEDGRVCAEEAAAAITAHMGVQAQALPVAGLQVDDAARFRRVGIQNLFGIIAALHRESGDAVLNATGGFKSVVPYITLYGLLYRLPVVYVFERSSTLIELPPAAIGFDHELIARAGAALLRLREEGAMAREDFFRLIPGLAFADRAACESLLEEEDGLVTASAFAHLVMPVLSEAPAEVLLCEPARAAFARASGPVRASFAHMLDNLGNALWRSMKVHAFHRSELTIYIKGSGTSERAGAFTRDGRIYVAELWQHDDYEREAANKRIAGYDLSRCTPWQPAMTGDDPLRAARGGADVEADAEDARPAGEGERRRLAELERAHERALRQIDRLTGERNHLAYQLGQIRKNSKGVKTAKPGTQGAKRHQPPNPSMKQALAKVRIEPQVPPAASAKPKDA